MTEFPLLTCKNPKCKIRFKPKHYRQKFCSPECASRHTSNAHKKRIREGKASLGVCKGCGARFSKDRGQQYCSKCRREKKIKEERTVVCPECKQEFQTTDDRRKYCTDIDCQAIVKYKKISEWRRYIDEIRRRREEGEYD